ncbi:MAG: RluA family pseudouridine synthase [Candidatus Pacebacteria bacterium]|nr:RluA family pseudouridine synthase [Candidatus Paceibacterota bacterium]
MFIEQLNIVYEDEHILAVNKPTGLMVHGDGRSNERTLADILVEKYPDMKEVGEPWESQKGKVIYRPGIVHRLDRDTSGALVIAKDQETYLYLKEQFQKRRIKKIYNAFVYGNIKEKEGVIDKPIGKSKKDFRQWSAQPGSRGLKREAVTEYKVLARGENVAYLELHLKTGRTHQLRVHLKAIHHPIVCDSLYAPKRECLLEFERLALHARSVSFSTREGEDITVEAPFPQDFEKAIAQL